MASAMRSPISVSELAAMVATCSMSLRFLTGVDILPIWVTTASTAFSMPRLSCSGFAPAVTTFRPCSKMASASTVAVVVPSPATSDVLDATSFTICAPMFS